MGLKALVTRWVEEWASDEFDARVDARLQAWAGAELKEQIGAYFDAAFREQFDALPKADLKELLDAYFDARADDFIGEKFDARFFTWADWWADKNLRQRLDDHFDTRLTGRLDTLVQARVANRIDDRIDRRIGQWIANSRVQAHDDVEPATAEPAEDDPAQGADKPGGSHPSASSEDAGMLVTAADLARMLRNGKVSARRVRELLRGHEVVPGHPYRYHLGDAAARVLLRRTRGASRKRRRRPEV
ncbi:hypothetical protein [Sphaerimonospora mesophila]|uniref:hypothetical protein n=1 Tax=Sphaerimonospora mesophila TaxID=37483 RepID=UPI00128EE0FB